MTLARIMLVCLLSSFATNCVTLSGSDSAYCLSTERPSHTEAEIMAADRETLIEWADDLDRWRVLCGD